MTAGNILGLSRQLCALAGHYTLLAIPGVIPLVHSGAACCQRLHQALAECNGALGVPAWGGLATPNDNIHRRSLIFGALDDLDRLLAATLHQIPDAPLYVVVTGCNVELVGDDVAARLRPYQRQGVPILSVATPGFAGSAYHGHQRIVEALVTALAEAGPRQPELVNLWGLTPYLDPFWRGNLQRLTELLALLGLTLNPLLGETAHLDNWRRIPRAALNLVVSPWIDLRLAQRLEQTYGTPWLQLPLPMGEQTGTFLQQLAEATGRQGALAGAPAAQAHHYRQLLETARVALTEYHPARPDHFSLVGDSQLLQALQPLLCQELGLAAASQFLLDPAPKWARQQLAAQWAANGAASALHWQPDSQQLLQSLTAEAQLTPPLLLASSQEQALATSLGGVCLPLTRPLSDRLILNRSYLGWQGGLLLIEEIECLWRQRAYGQVLRP